MYTLSSPLRSTPGMDAAVTLNVYLFIICPMRQQHWTDYRISVCVCQSVSVSVSE